MQLDCINYRQNHFIHADYSFKQAVPDPQSQINEFNDFLSGIEQRFASKDRAQGSNSALLDIYLDQRVENVKKIPISKLIGPVDEADKDFEAYLKKALDEKTFKTDFADRNQIVLKILAKQLDQLDKRALNPVPTDIMIYYGAGHNQFFEEQLTKTYGLVPESVEWITAITNFQ